MARTCKRNGGSHEGNLVELLRLFFATRRPLGAGVGAEAELLLSLGVEGPKAGALHGSSAVAIPQIAEVRR